MNNSTHLYRDAPIITDPWPHIIIDNFVKFDKRVVLIDISIINNIIIASKIVLIDLSNKKDNILLVK